MAVSTEDLLITRGSVAAVAQDTPSQRAVKGKVFWERLDAEVEGEMDENDLLVARAAIEGERASMDKGHLENLKERHANIARDLVAGMTLEETAQANKISSHMLNQLRTSPAFLQLLAEMHKEADQKAIDLGVEVRSLAADAIATLANSIREGEVGPEFVKEVADDMLDRAGFPKVERTEIRQATLNLQDIKRSVTDNDVIIEGQAD